VKTKLTSTEIAQILPDTLAVLSGEKKGWERATLHHPAGAIIDAILEIKGVAKFKDEESEGFDTNGWQWDWWQEFVYQGKRYTLSGSGHYGGHSFSISDNN